MVGGGVLAMSEQRTCRWCDADISGLAAYRVTCDHPICRRKANRHYTPTQRHKAQVQHKGAEQRGRLRVLSAWERSPAAASEWDRLVFVAKDTGESIATVIGVLRAERKVR